MVFELDWGSSTTKDWECVKFWSGFTPDEDEEVFEKGWEFPTEIVGNKNERLGEKEGSSKYSCW